MRRSLFISLFAAVPLTSATALDLPARKPGLWEISMVMEGRNVPPRVSQNCIDAATDKVMSSLGSDMRTCSKQDVQKSGGTLTVDSVCKVGDATVTSHSVVTGDFNSAYSVKLTSKREGGPPIPGMTPGAETQMTIQAKWLGACKADQKPGDMIMPNGMKINIVDMQKAAGAGGAPAPKR